MTGRKIGAILAVAGAVGPLTGCGSSSGGFTPPADAGGDRSTENPMESGSSPPADATSPPAEAGSPEAGPAEASTGDDAAADAAPAVTVGATTPFVSYEAEDATPGGGATVVSLTAAPTDPYSSPELEASGHAYVKLGATGQYVEWTNMTNKNVTAFNVRIRLRPARRRSRGTW